MHPQSAAQPTAPSRALLGVLLGTAVGDALGLPMEGVSARRQQRLFPGPLRHRLLGRWGMISDDTEHTLMLAQALLAFPADPAGFARALAWKLRWWLVSLPAGVGFATLRAILKLWLGVSPARSGVFSAGNGPAMRSALLGVYFAAAPELRRQFVSASSRLTHSDPRADVAAQAVAETAVWLALGKTDPAECFTTLEGLASDPQWLALVTQLRSAFAAQQTVGDFARALCGATGVSGYALHTVPVAIYAALKHSDDFPAALGAVIACGGDTDTVGAITGALVGSRVGAAGIPAAWRGGIVEWPRSMPMLERVAAKLGRQQQSPSALGPVRYFWPAIVVRNVVFLGIVLAHGFRRLAPPY